MSNIQRDTAYPVPSRYRRSPLDLSVHGGTFNTGQTGRTILPPLSSAFADSPYPVPQQESIPSRMTPSRNELFPPSYPPSYWPNSGHSAMAGHPYSNYPQSYEFDRISTQTPHLSYTHMRQSPGITTQESLRRPPPINIPQSRDETWTADITYPPNFPFSATIPESSIHSPTSSYPVTYDALHSNVHSGNYPSFHPLPVDSRHHPSHTQHSMHFDPGFHPLSHRSAHLNDWSASQRTETHLMSPYARTPRDSIGHSPQEPSPVDYPPQVKKKRKRADAHQLKVLNDVYARTAFPTTEERNALAKKLDMSARSVQIWFQNKRQSTRQSRSNALPPITQQYQAGSSTTSGPSPAPGVGHHGPEIAVSPTNVGGPYGPHVPSNARLRREQSPHPHPQLPLEARRARSPEGSMRPSKY